MKKLVLVGLVLLASVVVLAGCKNDSVPEIPKYTVTFDANGGTGEMTPQTFTANESQKLKENTFSKEGEIFLGWSKSTTGAVEYQNQEEISLTSNITLYAQWTPGIVVTSSTVESLSLESVTGEYHIVVEGKIDTTVISTFRKKINAAGEGAAIHLDLSLTEGLTEIPVVAFQNCGTLSSVSIPGSVTSIGKAAFQYCIGLTSVDIPSSVISIGEAAFHGCIGLTSVSIQEGVTSIGNFAFRDCDRLASVTIPNSVTNIGDRAFWGCVGLTQIEVAEENSNYKDHDGKMLIDKTGCLLSYPSAMGDISIPNDIVTSIGDHAFRDCAGLTCVSIPASVTSIGDYAFEYCIGLTSVTIPTSVTSIGKDAFYGCESITDVTFEDPYNWYAADNKEDVENSSSEISEELFSVIGARVLLIEQYVDYYWYKKNTDESI